MLSLLILILLLPLILLLIFILLLLLLSLFQNRLAPCGERECFLVSVKFFVVEVDFHRRIKIKSMIQIKKSRRKGATEH